MKKGYKECPFCGEEIKEGAIKCRYCREFLDEVGSKGKQIKKSSGKKLNKGIHNRKNKYYSLRKWGTILFMIPIIGLLWSLLITTTISSWNRHDDIEWDWDTTEDTDLDLDLNLNDDLDLELNLDNGFIRRKGELNNSYNKDLSYFIFAIIFISCRITSIILFIISKSYKEYDSKIKLLTPDKILGDYLMPGVYERHNYIIPYKDIDNTKYKNYICAEDVENMKKVGFVQKHNIAWIVILNIISFGTFGRLYNLLQYDYLPRIKKDDCGSGKALLRYFIPIVHIIRFFSFRTRLSNRINFQYKIRDKNTPITKRIVIAFVITLPIFLTYHIGFLSIILSSIYIGQVQKGINGLVDEGEGLSEN